MASAVHGDEITTHRQLAKGESLFELLPIWWMIPYPNLCCLVNERYPLRFKPRMIQTSDEEANTVLADVKKVHAPRRSKTEKVRN